MATEYYVDLHIAGHEDQEDHVRVGLVGSIPELADAYVEGCARLLERGIAVGDRPPIWNAVAREDEEERDLTLAEQAALAAALEQKFPDVKVSPPTPTRSPEQDQRKSRWEPPTDSDLIGIPLVVGMAVGLLVIALAFVFLGGWGGLIAVGVVVIAALVISYRIVASSEN
jgi:hypothetical protein